MNTEVTLYVPYCTISIKEKELWDSYIQHAAVYDFYHTWYYHSLEKDHEPVLFVYSKENDFIALPLLKREIEGTSFYDCTSVYGYAGPISNLPFETINKTMMLEFKRSFVDYLESENIIIVFSRLHPLINQNLLLDKMGGVYHNGKTVSINLEGSIEDQRSQYHRAIRQKIKQLRKKGFSIKEAKTKDEVLKFIEVYNENMTKVKAASCYFFEEQYFFDLLNADDFESKLLLTCYEDKIIAGGLVTLSNNIMQFHLAATANEFLSDCPMKLLFDEAGIIGRKSGMNYLHLGGGVGGREDSLFQFKAGFSNSFLNFSTWRYIANLSVYTDLVEERFSNQETNYNKFPLYRF